MLVLKQTHKLCYCNY